MSAFTEFRDSVVQAVVPAQYRDLTAEKAGTLAGQAMVKIASSAPAGNLTAAQIAAGQTGSASQGLSPAPAKIFGLTLSMPVIAMLGAGVIGAALIFRRRGR